MGTRGIACALTFSAYDKDWKLSRHSFSFANFIKFLLIMYRKIFLAKFDLTGHILNLAVKCLWLTIILNPEFTPQEYNFCHRIFILITYSAPTILNSFLDCCLITGIDITTTSTAQVYGAELLAILLMTMYTNNCLATYMLYDHNSLQ